MKGTFDHAEMLLPANGILKKKCGFKSSFCGNATTKEIGNSISLAQTFPKHRPRSSRRFGQRDGPVGGVVGEVGPG